MPTENISFTDVIASSIHDVKNSLYIQVNGLESIATAWRARADNEALAIMRPIIHEAHRVTANLIHC